jgi:hypothetical protein
LYTAIGWASHTKARLNIKSLGTEDKGVNQEGFCHFRTATAFFGGAKETSPQLKKTEN